MKESIHSNKQVKTTFTNIVNYIMHAFVHWLIEKKLWQNTGELKEGDAVVYNWKAKYYIPTVYNNKSKKGVKIITKIIRYSDGSEGCEYIDSEDMEDGSCDVFWVSKISWRQYLYNTKDKE